ncbi:uncharacterized protein LOC144942648 [Lampetra fluviatilis]
MLIEIYLTVNYINECALNSSLCVENGVCFNTLGSYECNCKEGYQGVGSILCQDQSAKCVNTIGSYLCSCAKGYTYIGDNNPENVTACVDINECNITSPTVCGEGSNCSNSDGSYQCLCNPGYYYNNTLSSCLDLDECATNQYNCSANSICKNTVGSVECQCVAGYEKLQW